MRGHRLGSRSGHELISQVLKLHGPEDLLCDLFGPFRLVLLNHQVHSSGPVCVLQPADGDGIRLQLQVILKQQEVLGLQGLQHPEQDEGGVQWF